MSEPGVQNEPTVKGISTKPRDVEAHATWVRGG